MTHGYYRHPAIHGDTIVFVAEDDLWTVPAAGGVPRRLTAGRGPVARPHVSPDGEWIAFTGTEEGHAEVHVMPASGGEARRLTYLGSPLLATVGWAPDGRSILFASNAGQPFMRRLLVHSVDRDGGEPVPVPWGPSDALAHGPRGAMVLGRSTADPARWKRYRGGRTGDLWIDPRGTGRFRRLLRIPGNRAWPFFLGGRVWFVSDHEGTGNLYSVPFSGAPLRRETSHGDFYVGYPTTDGARVAYQCGGDLHVLDPATGESRRVEVEWRSPRAQRQRRFVDAGRTLEDFDLHPQGHSVVLTTRGRAFAMPFWEEAVHPVGDGAGVRRRLARWLRDGERWVCVSDEGGEETLEVRSRDGTARRVGSAEALGRAIDLAVSPAADAVVLSNHRQELLHVDLRRGRVRVIDRSPFDRIAGMAWSPDGRWIAYGFWDTRLSSRIRIADARTGATRDVTGPGFRDSAPSFDPEGRYLHFLSLRVFDPVYDAQSFDLGFPRGMRPHLVPLQADLPSPFVPRPRPLSPRDRRADDRRAAKRTSAVEIDFDGIDRRVVAFPVPEGKYGHVAALRGKVAFSSLPVEGSLDVDHWGQGEPRAAGTLHVLDLETAKAKPWVEGITSFVAGADGSTLGVRVGNRVRVVSADKQPGPATGDPGRESGWLDLGRVRLDVDPPAEWAQMLREAWRLQRDQFWTRDMSGVDWERVHARWRPLVDRVGSRGELSDVLWEMQGELGTSHCYEFGGDLREAPPWRQGFLGADFRRGDDGAWRIESIVRGDSWDRDRDSPLGAPGVNAREGEVLHSVDGVPCGDASPQELLLHRAGREVEIELGGGKARRTVVVRALRDEMPLRYRAWVDANRARVHAETRGRCGYVHIPNMMGAGFAEFHRGFLAELDREGLIVDARWNGGGHVSGLLLEKLARRRLGFNVSRWGVPAPYPDEAPCGPMVALTNENAGSDGDMFSHAFKMLGLGPLIGKRTWGGVIGIYPRHRLVDGSVTTQPEFSFWFRDVAWGVENHGTDPEIEVEIRPQDHAAGKDPQMDRALREIGRLLRTAPKSPAFDGRPDLRLP